MKQRYNELTHDLCVRAVLEGLDGKYRRKDVLDTIAKYSGVTQANILTDEATGAVNYKLEAAEGIAYALEENIQTLLDSIPEHTDLLNFDLSLIDPAILDLDPVTLTARQDSLTGKTRTIADLGVMHQLYNHVIHIGIEPLLKARLLPQQFASIPDKGPYRLKIYAEKCLRRKSLHIRYAVKADVHRAYDSLQYSTIIRIITKEIPSARWIILTLWALSLGAPGGHLIIGGYLDAWLFNLAMSYTLRYISSLQKERRGKPVRLVRCCITYMDDLCFLGPRLADLFQAVKLTELYLDTVLGLQWGPRCSVIKFLSVEEEHRRKSNAAKAARGCPALDMGGYRIRRTYTTIRARVYRTARRAAIRANLERLTDGTVNIRRARRLTAYYGDFIHTDSVGVRKQYEIDRLQRACSRVISYHGRQESERRQKGLEQYAKKSTYN